MVQIPSLGILLVSHINQVVQPLFLSYCFLAEFPFGAWVPTTSTYLPPLLSSMQKGAQGGAPSDIQVVPVAQRKWYKFLVLEFYWYPT